jgi:uncharacterized protein
MQNKSAKELFFEKHTVTPEKLDRIFDETQTLDFKCTGCGDCCKGGGDVFFTDEDLNAIEEFYEIKDSQKAKFRKKFIQYKENGLYVHSSEIDCFFLKDNRCEIYSLRPLQCRSYPFWPSVYRSKDSLRTLQKNCAGAMKGTGKIFSRDSVIRRTNQTLKKFVDKQSDSDNYTHL